MRIADWISLFGLIFGPVIAVVISLWSESRRSVRERQSTIVRLILATRDQPADIGFHASIKAIPVEFRGRDVVLTAWEAYMAATGQAVPEGNDAVAAQVGLNTNNALNALIVSMLKALGHRERAANEIARIAYDPRAAVAARGLQDQVLRSVVRVADAVERSAHASEQLVARLPPPPAQ